MNGKYTFWTTIGAVAAVAVFIVGLVIGTYKERAEIAINYVSISRYEGDQRELKDSLKENTKAVAALTTQVAALVAVQKEK